MTARRIRLDRPSRPTPRLLAAGIGAGDRARLATLINAMPFPAAIFAQLGDKPEAIASNAAFKDYDVHRLGDSKTGMDEPRRELIRQIGSIIAGERDECQCSISCASPLGTRSFRTSLGRIAPVGPLPAMALFTAVENTDERRVESVLRRELLTDMLTTLPNRAGFLEEVEKTGEQHGVGGAIIAVDLVRFSRINESLGPMAGDEIIITVARRIKSILRAGDLIGRIGGNEFAIHSASALTPESARNIAARVRQALSAPIKTGNHLINIEGAVGCAVAAPGEVETEELFRRAQAAVRRAKTSGTFEIYRQQTLVEAQAQFHIENRLRDAIANERLHLAFQPFVSLSSGDVVGFEALARWTDPELGNVSPVKFIPVAEESGLIVPLGRWALAESARILADWDGQFGAEVPVTLNVNVSPVQMTRDDVPAAVEEALHAAGIDGRRLTIELTESAIIADVDKTRALLAALKAMHLSIAMDDFGTGFSNLANLQTLPIDVLKIDRSFIAGMTSDRDKVAIVRAILSLAGALGMRTVAEGIETAEVGQALAELGCDRGQGYYYAKPMTPEAAFAFWRERHGRSS